ncbi:MAG: hypothetical protein ACLFRV_09020, partial [Acidimicrobiales bacterium]
PSEGTYCAAGVVARSRRAVDPGYGVGNDPPCRSERMPTRGPIRMVAIGLAVVSVAAGCGGPDPDTADPDEDRPTDDATADDPASDVLGIVDALEVPDGTVVSVEAHVVGEHSDGDAYRLCSELAESHPPQCAGEVMFIVDDAAMLDQLRAAGDELSREGSVSWSDDPVVLTGHRRGPDGLQPTLSEPAPPPTTAEGDPPAATEEEIDVVAPNGFDVSRARIDPEAVQQHPVVPHRALLVGEATIELHLWGGVEPCWVLHSVTVTEDDSTVVVEVLAGTPPDALDEVCVARAVEVAHTIELDAPLGDRTLLARS